MKQLFKKTIKKVKKKKVVKVMAPVVLAEEMTETEPEPDIGTETEPDHDDVKVTEIDMIRHDIALMNDKLERFIYMCVQTNFVF